MIRDDELNRLIRYAQGMGLSVNFKPQTKENKSDAEWHTDGTKIIIYCTQYDTKLKKILSLIHELGHHKGFIENDRQVDEEFEETLEMAGEDQSKKDRRKILNDERRDTKHWEQIYKDTNCQFDIRKLHKQKEFDVWTYEVYYETGKLPVGREQKEKWKQLKKKHGV